MKPHLQCAEQQVSRSNLTKYCACHAERLTYLIIITYETSFTMRGATGVTIQPHQILRLPRKIALQNFWQNLWKEMKRHFQCGDDPRMIRPWSEHDPTMKTQTATRLASEVTFRAPQEHFLLKNTTFRAQSYIQTFTKYCACHEKCHLNFTKYCACHEKWHLNFTKYCACHEKWHLNFTKYCACHEKWHLNFTKYCTCHEKWHLNFTKYCACHAERLTYLVLIAYETSFTVRGATGVTIQPHQILRLPRKMTRLLYRPHIWNVISNARSNRCHYPTSPNTAPATKNDTARCQRKCPKTGETSFPMRGRSDHDPSMIRPWSDHENANRNPPRKWGYFSSSPRAFSIEKYNVSRPILHSNLHQILRLPRKVPLELHQILRLPRKVTLELHQVLRLPRKVTLELHQVLRLPRKVTLELHQVLRLPLYCNWTLLSSTLLDSTLLDTTLRDTTLLGSTLLASILLDSTLLDLLYLILLYLTLVYLTYSTWLYSTWLYSTWLYSTWHYSTWLYSTWLYSTWLYSTWLYSTWHYSTWLHSTWHYSTWLYSTWHYSTWLYSTWLYSTWPTLLDSTLLDTILLDSTLLDSTLLDSTLLDSTLLDSTLLDLTLLRCRSYIGSFST